MSISGRDELRLYARLAYNALLVPKYDLYKVPGPPGYWLWGECVYWFVCVCSVCVES